MVMLVAIALAWLGCSLLRPVDAMRADYLAQLRQETVDMFYHGYSNYMEHAFPEDEVGSAAIEDCCWGCCYVPAPGGSDSLI